MIKLLARFFISSRRVLATQATPKVFGVGWVCGLIRRWLLISALAFPDPRKYSGLSGLALAGWKGYWLLAFGYWLGGEGFWLLAFGYWLGLWFN